MCGITGFVHYSKKLHQADLRMMVNTIDYRGPDDEGYFLSEFQGGQSTRKIEKIKEIEKKYSANIEN